jgi:hypothetical protein
MITVDELLQKAHEYQRKRMSLEQFEDWFESASTDAYDVPELRELCVAVDGALAGYHYDYIGETSFRQELAAALRPFACAAPTPPSSKVSSNAVVIRMPKPKPEPLPSLSLVAASAALLVLLPSIGNGLRPLEPISASRVLTLSVRTPL